MTPTQFIASLWEQTRRTGPLLATFLFGGLAVISILQLLSTPKFLDIFGIAPDAFFEPIEALAHIFTVLIAIVLLMAYGDTKQLSVAIPQYALRLPVKTLPLIASRFVFNVTAFFIPTLILWHVAERIAPLSLPAAEMAGGYLVVFIYLQAWCWLTGAIPSVAVRIAILVAPQSISLLWVIFKLDPDIGAGVFLFGVLPLTVLAGYGIARQRRGETLIEAGWLRGLLDRDRDDEAPQFASAEEAQIWFERRQLGSTLVASVVVCGVTGTLIAVMIGIKGATTYIHATDTWGAIAFYLAETSSLIWLSSLTIGAFFTAAVAFLNQYRWQWGPGRAFFFARPISTKRLTRCRILASRKKFWLVTRIVLLVAGVAAAVNFIYATGGGLERYHQEASNSRVVVIATFYAGTFIFIAWCSLWIESIMVFGVALFSASSLAAAFDLGIDEATTVAALICIVILAAYVVIGFRLGTFATLTIARASALVVAAFLITLSVGIGIDMEDSMMANRSILYDQATWIGLIVAFLVFAPFVSTQFMLNAARHR